MTKILQLFNSDALLVGALQKGDSKAQRQLYERYAGKMLAVCRRYVSDSMAAEDVMIEGFMKVFEKIVQFKGEGSLEGWIKRLMTNEALMYLRSNRELFFIDINKPEAQQAGNEASIELHLEAEDLFQLLDKLPTGYRTVFNLYAIEGYSHTEIAEKLNITESTSKSQLHRARGLLQQLLAGIERAHKII